MAKYIRDPRRWEPLNVGVIVVRGDEARARFIGERDGGGSIDGRTTRHIVGDPEVFGEWVRYWRQAVEQGEEGAAEILARQTPNYWVADQGELWLDGDETTIEELARRYFSELVLRGDDAADASAPQLKERVELVLEQAEISSTPRFERDAVVKAAKLDPPENYKFHYKAENGHVTVGHRVSLEPIFIHDVLWKFEHLPDDYTRVAFVAGDEAAAELAPTLVHLRSLSHVINVFELDAVDETRKVFIGD
ncbi:MAG: hypothetical protein ACRDL2_15935 [Gaiellaceae bacterium]